MPIRTLKLFAERSEAGQAVFGVGLDNPSGNPPRFPLISEVEWLCRHGLVVLPSEFLKIGVPLKPIYELAIFSSLDAGNWHA